MLQQSLAPDDQPTAWNSTAGLRPSHWSRAWPSGSGLRTRSPRYKPEIDAVAEQGDSWEMPELLRVRGELRARSGDRPGAEQDLHAAMDLAEQQSALSWSLRVAASRARLAIEPKARADAVSDLKRIYARFVEGFETADLRDVREIVQVSG